MTLSSTLIFDHPTTRNLAASLQSSDDLGHIAPKFTSPAAMVFAEAVIVHGASSVLPATCRGAACLWHAAKTASDLVGRAPIERWGELVDDKGQVVPQDGAFIIGPELFDATFFKISFGEARVMDIQQRLVLEHMYCAMGDETSYVVSGTAAACAAAA